MMVSIVRMLRVINVIFCPPQPLVLFCFLSHKATRVVVPVAMIALALSSAFLWHAPFYRWVLGGQILFYGLALLGALDWLKPKALRLPFYFCMINVSLFALLYRVVSHRKPPASLDEKRPRVVWT